MGLKLAQPADTAKRMLVSGRGMPYISPLFFILFILYIPVNKEKSHGGSF